MILMIVIIIIILIIIMNNNTINIMNNMEFNNLNDIHLAINELDDIREALSSQEYVDISNYLLRKYNILNSYLLSNNNANTSNDDNDNDNDNIRTRSNNYGNILRNIIVVSSL